jgi:selenide,water dikinase
MQSASTPIQQDLVLIGGGHSHAIVLRMWAMQPLPGVRVTLISEGSDTPYSGMLPGHVAGFYSREACHIDLRSLCQFAGAVFYADQAVGLDLASQQVICAQHPPVGFDILSIDIGSTPQVEIDDHMTNTNQSSVSCNAIPAKPVPQFLQWWDGLCQQLQADPVASIKLAIIGGGVGGVELAINMQQRLQALVVPEHLQLHLFSRSPTLLPQQNAWVQRYVQSLLRDRGVQLHLGTAVTGWDGRFLQTDTDKQFSFDASVWVTQATAPVWLADAGLAVDARGFIQVDDTLRSLSHASVFAAGDIAAMCNHPRPKAGVFAVRQGKPLYENLRRALQGENLQPFIPQRHYLSLIGTGDRRAIAVRGQLAVRLPLLWQWKDWIDRRFMRQFDRAALGQMPERMGAMSGRVGARLPATDTPLVPRGRRCTGCGAKVGSSVLTRVLARIPLDQVANSVVLGLAQPDDAAVLQVPPDQLLVQTVDYFPALVDDPFLFGQIAANHSLSDLFAMGATADSVLAIVTLPYAAEPQQEETLFQLLSGALKVLKITNTQLVGGHTIEGEKLMFGLTCNGFVRPQRLLKKAGMQPGDCLILTKPLGTGTLFAAQMRYQAKPQWIDAAIASMLQSNYAASQIVLDHDATACTDITGFGLLGHLVEMLRAALGRITCRMTLQMSAIPLLPGAAQTTQSGIVSSLYPQNQRAQNWIENLPAIAQHPYFPLLFDPQTAGGLLASVPADRAATCLATLQAAGYTSQIIGQIHPELAQGALEKATLPITIED